MRVQKFLGRIGGYSHLLVGDVNLLQVAGTGGLAWDPVSRVKFTLPFREEKPDIWLGDIFLSFQSQRPIEVFVYLPQSGQAGFQDGFSTLQ